MLCQGCINTDSASNPDANAITTRMLFLPGVDLSHANLRKGWFYNAYLRDADLSFARMEETRLPWATLVGADLRNADIAGALFPWTDLTDADLAGATGGTAAQFDGAIWSNTTCPDGTNSDDNGGTCQGHLTPVAPAIVEPKPPTEPQHYPPQLLCKGCINTDTPTNPDQQSAVTRLMYLPGVDLSHANLRKAWFYGAYLKGADLSHARMEEARLVYASLVGANLNGADISGTVFTFADLTDADLSGATGATSIAFFDQAIWANTTCPDGTNSDDHGGTCEGHLVP